jgi:beta-phosphoglucomutase-like phosphatase (HAD superfamily)
MADVPDLPEAVIFDMDGTLCDVRAIRHLVKGPGGYRAFHRASVSCPPHDWVVDAAREQAAAGRAILIVTGREAIHRDVTAMWLALHQVPSDAMWMRAHGDYRPDYEVKRGILRRIRLRYRPVAAWDDNPAVVRLWEEEGIPVTVVPGWDSP